MKNGMKNGPGNGARGGLGRLAALRRFSREIRAFMRQASAENVAAYAASAAFFLFLSLLPLLMFVCAVLPYTPVTESMLMSALVSWLPRSVRGLAVVLVEEVYDRSNGILPAAAIVALWIGAKGMLALMRGLDAVGGVSTRKRYLRLRLEASLYTVLTLAAVLGTLIVFGFGGVLVGRLTDRFAPVRMLCRALLPLLSPVRFLLLWLVLAFLFALLYTYVPDRRRPFRGQLPGAAFAAVAWSLFSFGFSIYIDWFGGFGMYGRLTTVVIVMLWLYFGTYILLIGAKINHLRKGAAAARRSDSH